MAYAASAIPRLAVTALPTIAIVQQNPARRGFAFWAQVRSLQRQDVAPGLTTRQVSICSASIGHQANGPATRPKTMSTSLHAAASAEASPAADIQNDAATVSCEWLNSKLKDVKVLDASWYMPGEKRKPEEEFLASHIPGATFFDIDAISRSDTDLPHMLPSPALFGRTLADLGIGRRDRIVVYDGKGIFSAPRAWWMFRAFGHERVHVLEGGLPRWKELGYETESGRPALVGELVDEVDPPPLNGSLVREAEDVQRNLESKQADVIDARGAGRFNGTEAEPRKGVRGGHIPGSKNVPFPQVLTSDGKLRSTEELQKVFVAAGVSLERPIITSCGTGVTACVLALALHKLGKKDVAIYDGSWTEWGGREDLPVETK